MAHDNQAMRLFFSGFNRQSFCDSPAAQVDIDFRSVEVEAKFAETCGFRALEFRV